jgi:type III secretion protein L
MGLAFLITSDNLQILSERKVLKESEYSALLDANAIIGVAQQESSRIVSDAEQRKEETLQRGYQEGFSKGELDGAQRAFAATLDAGQALALTRQTMAEMVVRALRELVGEFDRVSMFKLALQRIDALVRDEAFLIVRVAPSALESMRTALASHRDAQGQDGAESGHADPAKLRAQSMRIVEDASLADTDCVVETPSGTIDARLSTQIAAIRAALVGSGLP